MYNCNLIVLSYHRFTKEPGEYQYSRTIEQFRNDLDSKVFDWITIDDGHASILQINHCLVSRNIKAKIFVSTSLVGTAGYCSWDDLRELSIYHDIENHSHSHENLAELNAEMVSYNIVKANHIINREIDRPCRYFVPPFNKSSPIVEAAVAAMGLQLINNRTDILNTTP